MRKVLLLALTAIVGVMAISAVAMADRGHGKNGKNFSARLNGWEEDPSQVTTGHGSFTLDTSTTPWRFTLRYEDLEGPAFMAHIHIGSRHESGGVSAWLCGASAVGNAEEKVCPAGQTTEAVINGTIEAADITGPAGQGVEVGAAGFADLLRALRHGETYTNVHTTGRATGGEIRGQNRRGGGHGKGHK